MPREQIEQLPAGRELDALIALQVMGFTMYHYDKDVAEMCYFTLLDTEGDAVVFRAHYRDGEHATEAQAWADCPAFSTDIAAAWRVFELFEWSLARGVFRGVPYYAIQEAGEELSLDEPARHYPQAHTAPLAICRAALLTTLI